MMGVTFTRCLAPHILLIEPTAVQRDEYAGLTSPDAARVIEASMSFTAWRSGLCLAVGGLIAHWPGRAEAWLLADAKAKPHMRPILRFMRMALDSTPHRRVEMTVTRGNEKGHKFADLLGFVHEADLEAYHPSGADVVLYKRVKK